MSGISLPYIVQPSTAQGMPIINPDEVLGNVSSASGFPTGITKVQLTALINAASTTARGTLAILTGNSSDYLGGDGAFHALIIPDPPPPPSWSVVATYTPTSGASLTMPNLDDYLEIIVIVSNMTISASGTNFSRLNWSFSADNGSTFLNTLVVTSAQGNFATGLTNAPTGSNTATAINAMMHLFAFNASSITPFFSSGTTDIGNVSLSGFVNTATALNAIRIAPGAASPTILGGTVTVLGFK